MNKFKLIFGILFIVLIGCQNIINEQVKPEPEYSVTRIDPLVDDGAQTILREALSNGYNKSSTTIDSLLNSIDYSEAILVQQEEGGISRYTFTLNTDEALSFENLIVQVNEIGEYGAMILKYEPELDWLIANSGVFQEDDFTGTIRLLTIDRIEFNSVEMTSGEGEYIPANQVQNKRMKMDCESGSGSNGGGGSSGEGGPESGGDTGSTGNDGGTGTSDGSGNTSGDGGGSTDYTTGTAGSCTWLMSDGLTIVDCGDNSTPDIVIPVYEPPAPSVTKTVVTCETVEAPTIGDGDAIGTLPNDDSVNLMEIIIADLAIHPCTEAIFNEIEDLQSGGIRNIIDQFAEESSQFIYEIEVGQVNNDHVAETYADQINSLLYVTIIDIDYLNEATDVAIARTLMHEAIHAYIQSYLVHIGQNNPELALMTFNELFQEFRNEKFGGIENIEQYQHEEMARNYVDTISSALKELFGSRFSDQFYEDLAWGGLLETDNFNNLDSFSEQEKERIRNVNYNEDKGTNDSKGVNCSPSN